MACTNDPSVFYPCSESNGDTGCNCDGNCLSWSTTAKIDTQLGSKVYPQTCSVAVLALEDTYTTVGLYFVSQSNPNVDYICTQDLLRIRINASYGKFDLFSTEETCQYVSQGQVQVCTVDPSVVLNSMGYRSLNTLVGIRYFRQNDDQSGARMVEIIGNWQQVNNSLNKLLYRPYQYQNTLRLRNYYYNPDATGGSNLPYEVMGVAVQFSTPRDSATQIPWAAGGGPWYDVGSVSQLVHIVPLNNAPNIYNPTLSDPALTAADCLITKPSQLPPGWLSPTCNFGSYFTLEDSTNTISISGVTIGDVDVYETCSYTGQAFTECHNLKVLFKVYRGTMLLNSRTDLNFIQNVVSAREGFLFTATVSAIASAVKKIYYNVDLPQLIGDPSSTTLHYNTQNGDKVEYISISVDDQGFTGWSGVLASTFSRINLTVVAVNNAPTVTSPAIDQYTVTDSALISL